MDNVLFWSVLGFFLGSIPFSYWAGRLVLKTDVRQYGDGNPGAANAWKAGGWRIGLVAVFLDIAKGLLPVVLARRYGVAEWGLVPVALAPVLGHAFSPFLGFHGGKALATTGGVWLGLIGVEAPLVFAGFTLGALVLQTEHAWTGIAGMTGLLLYFLLQHSPSYLIVIASFNLLVLVWKHFKELRQPLRLRPCVANLFARR